jgi:hypothetical protein
MWYLHAEKDVLLLLQVTMLLERFEKNLKPSPLDHPQSENGIQACWEISVMASHAFPGFTAGSFIPSRTLPALCTFETFRPLQVCSPPPLLSRSCQDLGAHATPPIHTLNFHPISQNVSQSSRQRAIRRYSSSRTHTETGTPIGTSTSIVSSPYRRVVVPSFHFQLL